MANDIFKRYEIKYMLTTEQKNELKKLMAEFMQPTEYSVSTINNIYFDTDDHLLIRRSLEKPMYKEKLRIRSYGTANKDTKVFVELKKKYDGVVYKRRIALNETEAMGFLVEGKELNTPTQISKELQYCMKNYSSIKPSMYLSYDREAFEGKIDKDFRMTFDENILAREKEIDLKAGPSGERLIAKDNVILEIKTALGMPIWLLNFLSKNNLYKTSFSKYGEAYKIITLNNNAMTPYLLNKALYLEANKNTILLNNMREKEQFYAIN